MKKKDFIRVLKEQRFSDRLLNAFEKVPRELFVSAKYKEKAYDDTALPIEEGQTISQPYTIAFMLSLLNVKEEEKVLEIGSGSGYVLAIMSELNKKGEIVGVERVKKLANVSKKRLKDYENVKVLNENVYSLKEGEYNKILVSASFDRLPQKIINKNLKMGGKMVVPVRDSIFVVNKKSGENEIRQYQGFSFVPIVKD